MQDEYKKYFDFVGSFIVNLMDLEKEIRGNFFEEKTSEELNNINVELYKDITMDNYINSYANPTYCVGIFGKEVGQTLSFLYTEIRACIIDVYEHRLYDLNLYGDLFCQLYKYITNSKGSCEEGLINIIKNFYKENIEYFIENRTKELFDPNNGIEVDIILNSDLNDIKYLYKYGEYIYNSEIRIAQYLNGLDQKTIDDMANTFIEAYYRGFENQKIDLTKKSTVNIRYTIGFERVVKSAIQKLEKNNLKPILYRYAVRSYNKRQHLKIGYFATSPNKQYDYDHRYDEVIYFDKDYADLKTKAYNKAYEQYKNQMKEFSGIVLIETFGEKPFKLQNKEEVIVLEGDIKELFRNMTNKCQDLYFKYVPGDEWSFVIISYPVPEIGDEFEQIFNDVIRVNNLDNALYSEIQQKIIDALDLGTHVEIKGNNGNYTDLVVKMNKLNNPIKETNFENCLADVNIPLGEVFTTPVLNGTNGVLYVKEVFLRDIQFNNLELHFENGFITDYSCSNFLDEKDNKKYVKENLLYNYDTLPISEFAIGTNTTAYVMAKKYNIMHLLKILILEKMGPHFAVGDTCYVRKEDLKVYNPNGKEIIAKDNEKTINRKLGNDDIYYNCHTDITIPYDELGNITVVTVNDERIDIIKNGRFVLKGTEKLNIPFEEINY